MPFDPSAESPTLLGRVRSLLSRIGKRIFVHLLAFATLMALPSSQTPSGSSWSFAYYIGFICLIPHYNGILQDWLIIVITSALQVFLWGYAGLNIHVAVFLGGLQAWALYWLAEPPKRKWHSITLFWIILVFAQLYGEFSAMLPVVPPYGLSLLLAVGAGIALLGEKRYLLKKRCQRIFINTAEKLEQIALIPSLPKSLALSLPVLIGKSKKLAASATGRTSNELKVAKKMHLFTKELVAIDLQTLSHAEGKRLTDSAASLVTMLDEATPANAKSGAASSSFGKETGLDEHQDLAHCTSLMQQLKQMATTLPAPLCDQLRSICAHTENSLLHLQKNQENIPQASRFLNRYLQATLGIAEQYAQLEKESKNSPQVQQVLQQSQELLQRLDTAFAQEHQRLLQNNVMSFSAELKALDTLLNMRQL